MNEEKFFDSLQLSPEKMQSLGYKVVDLLVEHFTGLRDKPVTRKAARSELEKLLREPLPESGTNMDTVFQKLKKDVFNNIMHLDHPRFFAFVPSPSNFVSVMADALTSGFNVYAGSWLEASGPTEIELVTIDWLRQVCGLPETAGGLFVSGGSVANLTGLAVARHVKLENRIKDAVMYCSDQTHSCIDRGVRLLGFEPKQLRKLPANKDYCLEVEDLRQEVVADRSDGKIPFCIIANAGTVNTGAVDPLLELADFCREEGMWLHVDGAYGAAAVLCDKGRSQLGGLEQVDSLALDPHKWLFQPYEIGSLLVRNQNWLKETFHIMPGYLKDSDRAEEEINYSNFGIQLTRSFRALKLWMSLKIFGLDAFRNAVALGIELAEKAEEKLAESPGWEIVTPANMGIVTFRYVPEGLSLAEIDALNRDLVDKMIADKFAMVSSTELRGRTVLRLCTINPRTTEADIQETVRRLTHFAKEGRH